MDKEIRQLQVQGIETRADANGGMIIEGYVANFNSKSKYIGFYEIIDPHAFDSTIADGHNIFMLYSHAWEKPLGDTETGTLVLNIDGTGLRFSLTIDNTVSYAADAYNLVKKNLIKGCSFSFVSNNDAWSLNDNMEDIRTLLNVTLLECTLTPIPAYNDTSASCRSYDDHKSELENAKKLEQELRELELIEIELNL